MALRIMRLNEVKAVTGLSKTTIYRFEKEGRFPSRVSLGERSVGWFEDDIEGFLMSLRQAADGTIA
ncbi:AlpA family transcriptional regulator [Porticoccaceae bacterium]|nr:AlpA family transcriptional regulator [Porticoccaceae bacterium]